MYKMNLSAIQTFLGYHHDTDVENKLLMIFTLNIHNNYLIGKYFFYSEYWLEYVDDKVNKV